MPVICPKCNGAKEALNELFDDQETLCRTCSGRGYVLRSVYEPCWCTACGGRHYTLCTCESIGWVGLERCVEVIANTHHRDEEEVREELLEEWDALKEKGDLDPEEIRNIDEENHDEDEEWEDEEDEEDDVEDDDY